MDSMIHANDLTKKFQEFVAVDHISFDVARGEIFGFLGPNGAGKTTTIRMLTTLAQITEGNCKVAGYDASTSANLVRQNIGLVPQEAAVDTGLTGMENLLLTAGLYHVPKHIARQRAEQLLDLVCLTEASKRLAGTYSGGMRKRLEIISGLMHEPKILFLDEPTLGLDIQTRSAIWEHIRKINMEKDITIFLTTHYLEEADLLCNRIAIIDHGKIKVSGTPSDLKSELGTEALEVEISEDADMTRFLESLVGVKEVRHLSEKRYRIKLTKIEQSLQGIFNELSRLGVNVLDTKLEKSSLDQVFLETTGRSMRDEVSGVSPDSFVLRAQAIRRNRN